MGKVSWKDEVVRDRIVWESSPEHAVEVWLTERQTAHKNLESVKIREEGSLLGTSHTVARVGTWGGGEEEGEDIVMVGG